MPRLRCVIFDLDHTLVNSDLDFALIKREIGTEMPILEYRATVGPEEQARVDRILDKHEERAAATCELLPGARELLDFLERRGVSRALLTRNSRKTIATLNRRLGLRFDAVVTREDAEPKPSPQPVLLICRRLGVAPAETLMVGDYLYDMQAGERAGTMTLLVHSPHRDKFEFTPDFEVSGLVEATQIIARLLDGAIGGDDQ